MMSTLISVSPFLVLIYVVFAFVQLIRHRRQSFGAVIVGGSVTAAPLIAFAASSAMSDRTNLMNMMAVGTTLMCTICIVMLLIERRDSKRDKKRSYGMLGLGMSVVLAGGLVVMTLTQSTSITAASFDTSTRSNTGNLINISQSGAEAANGQAASTDDTTPTEAATVLTAQTGLSTTDLLSQINDGSTIAQLVKANSGDVEAVKAALVSALEAMPVQMLSRLGGDTSEIASQLIEGQLPAQAQQMLTTQLISGSSGFRQGMPPQAGSGGFTPPGSGDGTALPANGDSAALAASQSGNNGGFPTPANPDATLQAPTQSAVQNTVIPTETVVRPTLIAFPTATLTSQTPTAPVEATTQSTSEMASVDTDMTCTLLVTYNLNLRDNPTQEGSTILLSIPYGTMVTTTGHTDDNWYQVTYQGQSGWISGEYVSPQASCSQLAALTN